MPATTPPHNFLVDEVEDLLTLPDGRKVHLRAAGPEDTPAIVLLHGLGGSSFEWVAVIREIAKKKLGRVYCADRAGYFPSSMPADEVKPTLAWLAQDTKLVLETAGIAPPYVLVGQSYGGDIARQCLLDWPEGLIAGMVIVDSPVKRASTSNVFQQLLGPSDYADVVGLSANYALTSDELAAMHAAEAQSEKIQEREMASAVADGALQLSRIANRQLLGSKPLSVLYCGTVNDFRKIYDHGVKHGYGSKEAREEMRGVVEVMAESDEVNMRVMLGLSSRARFVKAQGKAATHNVHIVDPECVANEVAWIVAGGKE